VAVAVVVVVLSVLVGATLAEPDLFWAVRAGSDGNPATDPYSWSVAGRPWVSNGPGFNTMVAWVYHRWAFTGLAIESALAAATVLVTVVVRAVRWHGARPSACAIVLTVSVPVGLGWLGARAQTWALLCAAVLLVLFDAAVRAQSRRAWVRLASLVAAMVCVQALWAYVHASAPMGVVLAGVSLGVPALASRRAGARGPYLARVGAVLGVLGVLALASVSGRHGVEGLTHTAVVAHASVGLISEWAPASLAPGAPLAALVAIVLAALALAHLLAAPRRGGPAGSARVATVVLLLGLGLASAVVSRFASFLFLVEFPILAHAVTTRPRLVALARPLATMAAALAAMVAVAAAIGVAAPAPLVRDLDRVALAALPAHCRLLNDYRSGGSLILLRPDVPVAVDGRNDLYGPVWVDQADRALQGGVYGVSWVATHHVTCVYAPSGVPLAADLLNGGGWTTLVDTGSHVVLARR